MTENKEKERINLESESHAQLGQYHTVYSLLSETFCSYFLEATDIMSSCYVLYTLVDHQVISGKPSAVCNHYTKN